MTINKKVAAVVSGIAIATTLGLAKLVKAEEFNSNGWPIPNISNAKFLGQKQKDIISEIPGKETLLKGYKSPDGTYFNTLEYNGRIYGFYVDTNGKMPMEYMLMDMEGNGNFDRKAEAKGSGTTPEWLLKASYNKSF